MLDTTHASQPWEGGPGRAPLRPATAAELGARRHCCPRPLLPLARNGSRCCATSLGRRTRAQRNRSRRRRRTFLWGARCACGPPGLPFAEFHDDGDTRDSLYEYQCLSDYGMVPKDNDIYTQRDPTLCKKRVCEPEEMQWCDDRNESRTTSCQHQRVSPCEGQDKIFYTMNVTANFVGLNTECTGDFGAIAGVPRSVAMSDEYLSSSNGCLQECQYPSGCVTLPMDNEIFTELVPSHAERDLTLCQTRVCEVGEKQWCFDRHESGVTHTSQWWNPCDEEGPYSF